MGYQLASVIAGGPAPLVATFLLKETGSGWSIAAAIAGCAVVSLIAVALLDDRSRSDINDDATFAKKQRTRERVGV